MKKLKRILLIAANAFCVLGILAGVFAFSSIRRTQLSQLAYARWRGESEERFAQVSVFKPADAALSESGVKTFRGTIDGKLAEAGMLRPETGSLWRDAWCGVGTASLRTNRGSATAQAYGIGGDFFLFHPLRLLSGQYLKPDELMNDRVVLSEQLAWKLYGGSDLAGMTVVINDSEYVICGVVRIEDDFAAKHAVGDETMLLFMDYSRFTAVGETPASDITCYELVMPEPLTGFARQLVQNGLGGGNGTVTVENSARFTSGGVLQTIRTFGERVMRTTPVVLPYWENAARYTETVLAGVLLLTALLCILPALTALFLLVKGWLLLRKTVREGVHRAGDAIERGRERRWEKKEAQKHSSERAEAPATETDPEPEDDTALDVERVVQEILNEKSEV